MNNEISAEWTWSLQEPSGGFRTGIPFFLRAQAVPPSTKSPPVALLSSSPESAHSQGLGSDSIELPWEPIPGKQEWISEFSVSLPGHYSIRFAGGTRELQVEDYSFISFGKEFGIFGSATVLLVGAMIAWLIRRARRTVPKSSPLTSTGDSR